MTTVKKFIGYSFPTSSNADLLGFRETGCWHVGLHLINIEGSDQCMTVLPPFCEGFADRNDPDLWALYEETEGEPAEGMAGFRDREGT